MAEVKTEKTVPKTITVDVNAESYNRGYDDAYEGCYKATQPAESFLGHTKQYWFDITIAWMPLLICFLVIIVLAGRSVKKQKEYMAGYTKRHDDSLDKQKQALEELKKINLLLLEISKKLDN